LLTIGTVGFLLLLLYVIKRKKQWNCFF
jgi:hypothetical protein